MSNELDLDSIEAQEAAALKITQLARREEAERVAAAAEKAKAKEGAKTALLPGPASAALVSDAMLIDGTDVCLDFEGVNGEARHVDVFTKTERMPKEETLAMRALLNSLGRTGLETATWDGMNGLIALYKPGNRPA